MKKAIAFIKKHDETCFGIGLVIAFILVAVFVVSYVRHVKTKARNQAINRAQTMDGQIYTINNVAWNFIGDTKLILKNEKGQDTGWIMIYMTNPLDSTINPLTLAFIDPHGRVPVPMRVRPRYRATPWPRKYDATVKDNFTGSYLEFEVL